MESSLRLLTTALVLLGTAMGSFPLAAKVAPSQPGEGPAVPRIAAARAPQKMPAVRNVNTATTCNTLQEAVNAANAANAGDKLEVPQPR